VNQVRLDGYDDEPQHGAMSDARRPPAGLDGSVWSRGGALVDEHLEELERTLNTLADGGGGWVSSEDEFASVSSPYQMRKRFFGKVELELEFERIGQQIRYAAHLHEGKLTRRQGPAGFVELGQGPTAVAREVETIFASMAAFVDSCGPDLRRRDPEYMPGPIGLFQEMWQSLKGDLRRRDRGMR
jgi:hypothetical protein